MKYCRLSWNDVLYNISWPNLVMLSACLPSYGNNDENTEEVTGADLFGLINKKQ